MPHQTMMARSILLRSTPEVKGDAVDDYDVTCYIVNEEEIIAEGEQPHVVCTGEPEEVCHLLLVVLFPFFHLLI
jgi:pyrimidine deaminase RibD-like protein